MNTLKIAHLYGNLMNTYGDNGNLLMLEYYSRKLGYEVQTTIVSLKDRFIASDYDLVLFGGGQDFEQKVVAQDLPSKKEEISKYIENNGVLLAICGGFQLLGQYYVNADGDKINGLGIMPHYTKRQIGTRFIGDVEIYDETHQQTLYGFENHNGVTYLTDKLHPLGKIIQGNGNNGEDKTEGVLYRNVYGSYFHGPMLVRNEWLAQHLVELAINNKQTTLHK